MINKERVQHIRNLIYSSIILLIFVPVILIIILCFRMVGAINDLTLFLSQTELTVQGVPESDILSRSGENVTAPENQGLSTAQSALESRPLAVDGQSGAEEASSSPSLPAESSQSAQDESEPESSRQEFQGGVNIPDSSQADASVPSLSGEASGTTQADETASSSSASGLPASEAPNSGGWAGNPHTGR